MQRVQRRTQSRHRQVQRSSELVSAPVSVCASLAQVSVVGSVATVSAVLAVMSVATVSAVLAVMSVATVSAVLVVALGALVSVVLVSVLETELESGYDVGPSRAQPKARPLPALTSAGGAACFS
jgi:hypothetical protein